MTTTGGKMSRRTEHEEIAARNSLAREAKFESHEVENELTRAGNKILRELGEEIGLSDPALSKAKYLGSAAVHIYKTENLGIHMFSIQVSGTIGKTPELLASAAFTELQNNMMSHYGRQQRRKFKA